MTKKIMRCKDCGLRAIYFEAGFISETSYICVISNRLVDRDDGCTFGEPGEPRYFAHCPTDVNIQGDSATNGWHIYERDL